MGKAWKPGSTILELVISIAIFSMAIMALIVIEAMAVRRQTHSIAKMILDNHASMIGAWIRNALISASYIQSPALGATSPSLTAWENVHPEDGSPIDPSLRRSFRHFCVHVVSSGPPEQAQSDFYLYEGSWPMPVFSCGALPPLGVQRIPVAGAVRGLSLSTTFRRPSNNVLQIHCAATWTKPGGASIQAGQAMQMTVAGAMQ
jgi:hypothetical protein